MISLWCSAYSRQSASYLWLAKGFHFSQFWQCHADSLGYFSGLGIYPADSVSWSCSGSYRYGGGSIDVVVNLGTALLFLKNSQHDLNIRGAFLHMAVDAAVSVGVVIAGALYLWQGWLWIDAVVGLIIAIIIILGTFSLFRQSLHLLFDGVPDQINLLEVRNSLLNIPSVVTLHDLPIWSMSTLENALTVHVVYDEKLQSADALLAEITEFLHHHFDLNHVTVQLESIDYAEHCEMNHKDHVS